MKNFLLKSLFFILVYTFFVGSFVLIPTPENNNVSDFMGGVFLKHKRLDLIKSPRILLAAGSNIAFGIDSERIEKTFSIPVVNLANSWWIRSFFYIRRIKKLDEFR